MLLLPSNPNDSLHPTYYERKGDVQAEYASLIKTASWNIIQNVNLVNPIQIRRVHEVIMCDVNREVRYVSTKYRV